MADPTRYISFDRVADIYDQTRALPGEALAHIAESLAALVEDGLLLEVGIGTGRIALPLAQRGTQVVGLDISQKMLEILRLQAPGMPLLLAEATSLPFPTRTFDAVLFVHVLHLVPDIDATIRAALEVLRPGGVLIACGVSGSPGKIAQAGQLLRDRVHEVTAKSTASSSSWGAPMQRFREFAREQGLALEDRTLATWSESQTGRQLLAELQVRLHSWMWPVTDDQLPGLLERCTREIDELYGGLETVHSNDVTFEAAIARA